LFVYFKFHPEKVQYEWTTSRVLNRDRDSIFANFYLASFFVEQAKLCEQKMKISQFKALAIYNHSPLYTGTYFQQQYKFPVKTNLLKSFFRQRPKILYFSIFLMLASFVVKKNNGKENLLKFILKHLQKRLKELVWLKQN
jgi:hypothetical protein